MKKRSNIREEYKMDLTHLFENDEEFLLECKRISKDIPRIKKYKGRVLKSSNTLLEVLNFDRDMIIDLQAIYFYSHFLNDADLGNATYNTYFSEVLNLYSEYNKEVSFLVPEIISDDIKNINKYIRENENLREYQVYLKEIFRLKEHQLSPNEEELLSLLSPVLKTPREIASKLILSNLDYGVIKDETNKKVDLNSLNYVEFQNSKKREVRYESFYNFYSAYESIKDAASTTLNAEVVTNNVISKIKGYGSFLECALYKENVDFKIYDNLLNYTAKKTNILEKYYNLIKDELDINEMHIYDITAPFTMKLDQIYTYDKAKEIIINVLSIFGEEYLSIVKKIFDEKWIDVMPSENKRTGSYTGSCFKTHPYIHMNFGGEFTHLKSLIHEIGHAVNSYYSKENNSFSNYESSLFVREVASQVNEILLINYLVENTEDEKEKVSLINELLKMFNSSVTSPIILADFEKNIYDDQQDGTILTKDYLDNKYLDICSKYYKGIKIDDVYKNAWVRSMHLYYKFCAYQYPIGFMSALTIADKLNRKKSVDSSNYIDYLKLGSTLDPVATLKVAGVDAGSKKMYSEAFDLIEDKIDELKKIIKKEGKKK